MQVAGLSLEENNKDSEKTQKHQAPSEFWPSMESSSDAVLILNIPLFSEYLVSNVEDDVYGAAVNLRKVLPLLILCYFDIFFEECLQKGSFH